MSIDIAGMRADAEAEERLLAELATIKEAFPGIVDDDISYDWKGEVSIDLGDGKKSVLSPNQKKGQPIAWDALHYDDMKGDEPAAGVLGITDKTKAINKAAQLVTYFQ